MPCLFDTINTSWFSNPGLFESKHFAPIFRSQVSGVYFNHQGRVVRAMTISMNHFKEGKFEKKIFGTKSTIESKLSICLPFTAIRPGEGIAFETHILKTTTIHSVLKGLKLTQALWHPSFFLYIKKDFVKVPCTKQGEGGKRA